MSDIRRIILRRLRNVVITIFGIMTLNFFLINMLGDPVLLLTPRDPKTPIELYHANGVRFGLCGPDGQPLDIFTRYWMYLANTVQGNWGTSYFWRQPVFDLVMGDLGWTLILVGTSTVLTIIIGMVLGSISAQKRGKPFDLATTAFSLFFYGMPVF